MRMELTDEERKNDLRRIEEIFNSKFIVDSNERYWFFQLKENRKYVLATPSYKIEPNNRFDGFPTWKNVILLKDVEDDSIAAFQPELLLAESTKKGLPQCEGDINIALRRFIKLRPMSTNKDISIFLENYIGDKEVYLIQDSSKPINGWICTFNLFTQPSLQTAISHIKN